MSAARRSLDQGETAALEAALSLIDDMDDGGLDWIFSRDSPAVDDDNSGSSVAGEDAAPPSSSQPTKPTRKRHRNRRKDEIVYLRDKVDEMQRTLDATKQRIADAKGIAARDVELISIWEEFATRQQRKRHATELENAKLRDMLETQVQVAKQLMEFLQRQPTEEEIPGMRALKRLQLAPVDIMECSHDNLLKRMDAQYGQTDAVFDSDKWHTRRTIRDVHVCDDDSEDALVEISSAWVVPFELEHVANVLKERSERVSIEPLAESFETLAEKDRMVVSLFTGITKDGEYGHSMSARGRVVTRYYPEPSKGRAVLLSELNVEPPSVSANKRHLPFSVQSQGWIRLVPYTPNGETLRTATTQHLTHIQWFRRVRIFIRPAQAAVQQRQTGMFTEVVLQHISRDLDESQSIIEDLLLEDVMNVTSA